jgi:hypothetical protein
MNLQCDIPSKKTSARRPILLAAMLRGARFGALVAGGIMFVMGLIGLSIGIGGIAHAPRPSLIDFAGMFGGVALSAVYGAIAGAVIMGTIAAMRLCWSRKPG